MKHNWNDLFATSAKPKGSFEKQEADGTLELNGTYEIRIHDFKTLVTKDGNTLLVVKGRAKDGQGRTAFIDGMYSLDGSTEKIRDMQSDMMYKLATALGLDIVEVATTAGNDPLGIFKAVGAAAKAKTIYSSVRQAKEFNGKMNYTWNNFDVVGADNAEVSVSTSAPVKTTDDGQLAADFDF